MPNKNLEQLAKEHQEAIETLKAGMKNKQTPKQEKRKFITAMIISISSIVLLPLLVMLLPLSGVIQEVSITISATIPFVITIILFDKLNPLVKKRYINQKGKGKGFVYGNKSEDWDRKY